MIKMTIMHDMHSTIDEWVVMLHRNRNQGRYRLKKREEREKEREK